MIGEIYQEDQTEALEFLAARPIHTVFLSSLIRDNGLASPHNRGSFYACRDGRGKLEGVGLLGHATVIEARTDTAISAFARLARNCFNAHLIRGERNTIDSFWKRYASPGQEPRLICRELMFEQREALPLTEPIEDLRMATLADLDQVLKVNAAMALQEAGISPLNSDPGGFRQRTARRIEQGRIWIWTSEDKLMFKADVVAETPEAIYLEGVYVNPLERSRGYGARCMSQLGQTLLSRAGSLCILVNDESRRARCFFERIGFNLLSYYDVLFLDQPGVPANNA